MVLRVISLVQRATGSMVSQWRLVSVTDSGQRTEMPLVKVSSCSYLLFLIFINDLLNCVKQSKVVLYADDTALFFANKDVMTIERVLQEELNSLNNWFHKNGLILNCSKTNVMVFGTSQRLVKTIYEYCDIVWSNSDKTYLDKLLTPYLPNERSGHL